jgi:enoyl-CoA hydratase/carnithine racemase
MLTEFPKPVIAAVNGYAVGIGCIVTYCYDLIIASDRVEWRCLRSLWDLPNHGGSSGRRAGSAGQAMVAMGYPMTAEETFRFGLAQWLVPHAELVHERGSSAGRVAAARTGWPRIIEPGSTCRMWPTPLPSTSIASWPCR